MNEIITRHINQALDALFPYGEGRVGRGRVEHQINQVAQRAYTVGRSDALIGLMTAKDVAEHFRITPRRARALIANRHERFGIGMRIGASWLIHRDELDSLEPNAKYRAD
jgi:hypothetical protein